MEVRDLESINETAQFHRLIFDGKYFFENHLFAFKEKYLFLFRVHNCGAALSE